VVHGFAQDAGEKNRSMAPDVRCLSRKVVQKLPDPPRRKIGSMAEEKNGLSDVVQKGAGTANAIRGAIKTGKAISGAAKGAAAGGIYGAAAGFLWENKKIVGKIIIISIALLMLPVLFILMLPSLIFGGLTNGFSPNNPEVPILNDGAAIVENANNISFAINRALGEGLDDVLARIDADFSSSGGDQKEINNTLRKYPIYNANRFVGSYCAAMIRTLPLFLFRTWRISFAAQNQASILYSEPARTVPLRLQQRRLTLILV
jgi:hypothetical protein